MKPFSFLLIFLFGAELCLAQAKKSEQQQLDSVFSVLYQQNQFNGSVLVADKGKVLFKKGYGYSDENTHKTNNAQTIFELASCSKQFTAAAIVLLKRQGKLNYDDRLSKFIPELASWSEVTIYDLLRHTSGLPEYLVDMQKGWDKTKIATNEDLIKFYAAKKDTLQFKPKSRHRYNNTNYALLASIVERASGDKFGNYLAENIFKPLKMSRSFVYNRRESPKKLNNYAVGYVWARGTFNKITSEQPGHADSSVYYLDGIVGNAKVNSTVEDLYKWIIALKNNTLFNEKEFAEMTAVTQTSAGKNISYGFGFDLAKGENRFSFGHTGSWDGYVSFIYQNMIKDRTVIVLQNFELGTYPYGNINEILDHQPIKAEYKKIVPLTPTLMQTQIGTYIDENGKEEHVITTENGYLFYNTKRVKWDMRFFPTSASEFQGIRQGGADGVLRFTQLENGDTKLEMIEYGKVIGSGIRKKQS